MPLCQDQGPLSVPFLTISCKSPATPSLAELSLSKPSNAFGLCCSFMSTPSWEPTRRPRWSACPLDKSNGGEAAGPPAISPSKIIPVVADVASPDGQKALFAACPQPDILVNNNAGPPFRDFRELDRQKMIDGVIGNMIVAIELTRDKALREPYPWQERRGLTIYRHALTRGVLLRPVGNVVYFMPPYVITPGEIDLMVEFAREGIERATCG